MKRFISILLVAILIVTSLATVAFAAGSASVAGNTKTAKAGEEVTLTFTVSGEFANYQLVLSTSSPLEITEISGATANVSNGKVAWASDENVTSHSFTVTVKVSEDAAPGTYPVSVTVDKIRDRNGELQTVTPPTAGYIVIEEPACVHDYKLVDSKDSTCIAEGFMTYKCSKCGHTYTEVIALADHKLSADWEYNTQQHWHICTVCENAFETADHNMLYHADKSEKPTETEDGYKYYKCEVCAYDYKDIWEKDLDDVLDTGDITPVIALGVTSVITLGAASLYVFKRKNAK